MALYDELNNKINNLGSRVGENAMDVSFWINPLSGTSSLTQEKVKEGVNNMVSLASELERIRVELDVEAARQPSLWWRTLSSQEMEALYHDYSFMFETIKTTAERAIQTCTSIGMEPFNAVDAALAPAWLTAHIGEVHTRTRQPVQDTEMDLITEQMASAFHADPTGYVYNPTDYGDNGQPESSQAAANRQPAAANLEHHSRKHKSEKPSGRYDLRSHKHGH
jgi:hypothetical protein